MFELLKAAVWLVGKRKENGGELLANGCDNADGKIKRAREFPLPPGSMWLRLNDHSFNLLEVSFSERVLISDFLHLLLQNSFSCALPFRLERIKHSCPYKQIGNGG